MPAKLFRLVLNLTQEDIKTLGEITQEQQLIDPGLSRNMLIRQAIREWVAAYKRKKEQLVAATKQKP